MYYLIGFSLFMSVLFMNETVVSENLYKTQRNIIYTSSENNKQTMTLYDPVDDGTSLRPAVVLIHGGGWVLGQQHDIRWYGPEYAKKGYVVARISYRLLPRYTFPDCLYDCKAAVRWLRLHAKEYRIDPDHIIAQGDSAGGHLAAMLAVTRPEDDLEGTDNLGVSSAIQGAVVYYGVLDLDYYLTHDTGFICELGDSGSNLMSRFAGTESRHGMTPLETASPISYVHPEMPPVFLVQGTDDVLVPYPICVNFFNKLCENGVPARMITVPYNHVFDMVHWKVRRDVFNEAETFLEEKIGSPSGGKP